MFVKLFFKHLKELYKIISFYYFFFPELQKKWEHNEVKFK